MSKIAIMETLGISPKELAAHKLPFEQAGHEFVEYLRSTDVPTLIKQAKDADAIIIANMPMPGDVISACHNLKYIDVAFTGVDHVDLAAAKEKGIAISNASGYSNEAVSELVLGMTLNLLRHVEAVQARCREGKTKDGLIGSELMGKTIGIIGYGRIGRRTGELFHAFGCNIFAQNHGMSSNDPAYVERISQEELLSRSDVVVLHCPLNGTTKGMIDAKKLAMMKPSAFLINVSRGPVVIAQDLANALNEGMIAGAGIDVFDKEPPLDLDDPLLHCKNCLVTPHIAFATKESMSLRAHIVFDNLRAWLEGKQKNSVI